MKHVKVASKHLVWQGVQLRIVYMYRNVISCWKYVVIQEMWSLMAVASRNGFHSIQHWFRFVYSYGVAF